MLNIIIIIHTNISFCYYEITLIEQNFLNCHIPLWNQECAGWPVVLIIWDPEKYITLGDFLNYYRKRPRWWNKSLPMYMLDNTIKKSHQKTKLETVMHYETLNVLFNNPLDRVGKSRSKRRGWQSRVSMLKIVPVNLNELNFAPGKLFYHLMRPTITFIHCF